MCVCVRTQSCLDSLEPHRLAHQARLSMESPRKEYWSLVPFSTPGDLPHPGIEPTSLESLASPAL